MILDLTEVALFPISFFITVNWEAGALQKHNSSQNGYFLYFALVLQELFTFSEALTVQDKA